MQHKMKSISLALSVVVLLSVLACSNRGGTRTGGKKSKNRAEENHIIRIACLPTIDALPYFVAMERGLFSAEGLETELDMFQSHLDIDTALIGGSADGAFTDIIRLEQMYKKDSLRLCALTSTELQWTLITNRVARLNKLEQFGDKMVAMTRFSATDYLTDKAFANVKTTAPVFKIQINNVELRLKMMQNNEMDAVWLPEPYAAMAVMSGHKAILKSDKYKKKLGVLAFRQTFIDKNKHTETMEKLAKVYSMACDSINKNGINAYSAELQKYCSIDTTVLNRLPELSFSQAVRPSDELIEEAHKYLNQ